MEVDKPGIWPILLKYCYEIAISCKISAFHTLQISPVLNMYYTVYKYRMLKSVPTFTSTTYIIKHLGPTPQPVERSNSLRLLCLLIWLDLAIV